MIELNYLRLNEERSERLSRRTRKQTQQIDIEPLIAQLDQLKSSVPLGGIFGALWQGLNFLRQALKARECSQAEFEYGVKQIRAAFQLLPQEFTDRHSFDLQMIDAIKKSWNGDKRKLFDYVIPVYGDKWEHQRLHLSVKGLIEGDHLNVIQFRGDSDLDAVDLLDYPLLCHELAHDLYVFDDSFFRQCFNEKLKMFLTKLRMQSISDHGAAKKMSERTRQKIEAYWQPTDDHKNWAHEMAMDLTAVWTCGPAYVATLIDEMDSDHIYPYLLTQEHPPNAVRVEAIIRACQQLGWEKEVVKLKHIVDKWRRSRHKRQINNHYVAMTNPDLIAGCVQCVMATCQCRNLPKCNKETVARIRRKIVRNETPDWDTELILAAWLKYELDKANYATWQEGVIQYLLNSLTP